MGNLVSPSDQTARVRFATELDRNFSVVASAGSGKTTAITERVLAIARHGHAAEILPHLVVVTYANRAADEMQQRARQKILEENLSPEVQTAFNRAFFGTIHSFCMKLLTDFGHHLGLPAPLELLADDDELWAEFVQSQTRIGHSLSDENRTRLLRLVQVRDLMELARGARGAVLFPPALRQFPLLNFREIYAQTDSRGSNTVSKSQDELRAWEERYASDWEFLRWPVCFSYSGSFTKLWAEKFSPLRKWISDAATCVAAEVQRDYREFRLERGLVTYDDQIALTVELLQHPTAGPGIREEHLRVILDEAQDTDPAQFSVLLEVARPPSAEGRWPGPTDPPRPGHFCMVGDFQQSIYRDSTDLNFYRAVHNALIADEDGEALTFSVTFRLDEKQLHFINQAFREILHGRDDQVHFVELHPRPEILPGKVIRVPLGKELLPEGKLKDYQKARIEAEFLATWIKGAGLKKLSADSWREVAILCPRKAWLQTMAAALRKIDLPVSIQSERDVKGDSPAYAWLTALCIIMTQPRNAYEIVGVLREIFGVSDHDLAVFAEAQKHRFRIDEIPTAAGKISTHLRALAEIRQRVESLALFDAIAHIIERSHLRERLLLLPAGEFGDLGRELDALLAQAAEAEAEGAILAEFAERLRADFSAARSVRFSANDNAIQLITSHKAKGSEWQAVIVPFLARDLRPPSPRYPHFVQSPKDGERFIAFGKEDKSKELKEALERAQAQALERLLYVATTRARRTLVLGLDQEIFSNTSNELPRGAQLRRLLRGANSYAGEFDEQTSMVDEASEEAGSVALAPSEEIVIIDPLGAREIKRAESRAAKFVRRFTPSALEAEITVEVPTRSRLDNPATLYGNWWHQFLERIDWRGGEEMATRQFEECFSSSPNPSAARKDWDATRKNLFTDTSLTALLAGTQTSFHRELPFSWRMNENTVFEGLIDSLMIDPETRRALLIDWKTNRITERETDSLRARYLPQIAAYWKAVGSVTGFEVKAGLFSIPLGKLLTFEPVELKQEWNRLENLPAQQIDHELDLPDF